MNISVGVFIGIKKTKCAPLLVGRTEGTNIKPTHVVLLQSSGVEFILGSSLVEGYGSGKKNIATC